MYIEDIGPIILIAVIFFTPIIWFIVKRAKITPEEKEKEKEQKELAARRAAFENPVDENGNVKCPYCGSLQIQMVPRKWSPVTGFFTNRADRVCMRCKKKF